VRAFISLLLTVVMRGIAVLRVLTGGTLGTYRGYSEYSQGYSECSQGYSGFSQGVLGVLTGVLRVLTRVLAIAVANVAVAVAVAVGAGVGVAYLYTCQRKYRGWCWLHYIGISGIPATRGLAGIPLRGD
jgi:hypothetical protein